MGDDVITRCAAAEMATGGASDADVARAFGVSRGNAWFIRKGLTWRRDLEAK